MSLAEVCVGNHGVIELLRLLSAGWKAEVIRVDDMDDMVNVACVDHNDEQYRLRFEMTTLTSLFLHETLSVGDELHVSDDMQHECYTFALDHFMNEPSYLRFCSVKELTGLFRGRPYTAPVCETEPCTGSGLIDLFEDRERISSTAETLTDANFMTRGFLDFEFGTEFTQSILEEVWEEKGSKSGDAFRRHAAEKLSENLFDFITRCLKQDDNIDWNEADPEKQFAVLYDIMSDFDQVIDDHGLRTRINSSTYPIEDVVNGINATVETDGLRVALHAYIDPDYIVSHPGELRSLYRAALQIHLVHPTEDLISPEASSGSKTMHGYNAVLFIDKAYPAGDTPTGPKTTTPPGMKYKTVMANSHSSRTSTA
jgi:hypothetical protein